MMWKTWEEAAKSQTWQRVDIDPSPDRNHSDPCLYNPEFDRVWPLDDWEGAAKDVGIEAQEVEEYKPQFIAACREYAQRLYGYGDLIDDNEDRVDQAITLGETPEYFIEYLTEKYGLERIN